MKRVTSIFLSVLMLYSALIGGILGSTVAAEGFDTAPVPAAETITINAAGGQADSQDLKIHVSPLGSYQVQHRGQNIYDEQLSGGVLIDNKRSRLLFSTSLIASSPLQVMTYSHT